MDEGPIVAVVSEKNSLKRVFYEVNTGVLSAPNENSKTRLIADEVVIRQVKMQEKVRKEERSCQMNMQKSMS